MLPRTKNHISVLKVYSKIKIASRLVQLQENKQLCSESVMCSCSLCPALGMEGEDKSLNLMSRAFVVSIKMVNEFGAGLPGEQHDCSL